MNQVTKFNTIENHRISEEYSKAVIGTNTKSELVVPQKQS